MELRKKMLEMLESTCIEENYEITGNLLIQVALAAMNNSNVYIVAENDLHTYVRLFKSWNLHVHKVVCALPKDFQKVDDVEIIPLAELLKDETPRKMFFVDAEDHKAEERKNFFEKQFNNIPSAEIPNKICLLSKTDKKRMALSLSVYLGRNFITYYQSHKENILNKYIL